MNANEMRKLSNDFYADKRKELTDEILGKCKEAALNGDFSFLYITKDYLTPMDCLEIERKFKLLGYKVSIMKIETINHESYVPKKLFRKSPPQKYDIHFEIRLTWDLNKSDLL